MIRKRTPLITSRCMPEGASDRAHEPEEIDGVLVSEGQIEAWVAEAEAGYDIESLKRRKRGRPGRGAEPTQVVAIRLTAEERAAIDERACPTPTRGCSR